jgi:hypothetical protein
MSSEATTVAASRTFHVKADNRVREIQLVIFLPEEIEHGTWRADYMLSAYADYDDKKSSAFGMDSLDALRNAMRVVDSILSARRAERPDVVVEWLGSSSDLGLSLGSA